MLQRTETNLFSIVIFYVTRILHRTCSQSGQKAQHRLVGRSCSVKHGLNSTEFVAPLTTTDWWESIFLQGSTTYTTHWLFTKKTITVNNNGFQINMNNILFTHTACISDLLTASKNGRPSAYLSYLHCFHNRRSVSEKILILQVVESCSLMKKEMAPFAYTLNI